ncbi:MAG: GHKL domain-containing protein [Flavobacterium sp.]|nr:GHKL domain-containing protein [Pedobacter sp.]
MKFIILAILYLWLPVLANAQPVISLINSNDKHPVGKHTMYYRDKGFNSVEKILQPNFQSQFKLYNQDVPNFGSTADAIWFKFIVTKQVDKDFYLQIGSAFIDSIALYKVIDDRVQNVQVSGDNYIFSHRALKVTPFLFPLNIPVDAKQTYLLRVKTMQPFFFPLRIGTLNSFMEDIHKLDLIQGIYLGFMLLILLYNLFLYFSTKEKLYLYYVAYVASITWFMSTVYQYVFEYLWPGLPIINSYAVASTALTILTATLFTREFLHTRKLTPRLHKISFLFIGWGLLVFVLVFTPFKIPALMLAQAGIMLMAIYFLIAGITIFRQGYHPAKFYLVAWSFLILGFIAAILETVNLLPVMYYINSMQIGSAIEVTLLSLALADRINIYKKQREEAQEKALIISQEKSELISEQNIRLEQKVSERTIALTKSLDNLKEAQSQIIQSEKMASLGELTAGIAHEIQNPLNFVNNFSEVSNDLIDEMYAEIEKGDMEEAMAIANDLKQNLAKINHHGKRADAIVKGMLQHSRNSSATKELTNINKLADEYLRLAYHGLRSKDKSFNATMLSDYDETIGNINIIPQDIGRVILNLITNAFYAVSEKQQQQQDSYVPIVSLSTKKIGKKVAISVKDNGNGIPQKIMDKIFQPFFTTKPTGQGTGLGLSLSYDIVKAHGGELKVETKEGEGSEFIIRLPG